jgi:UDP-galactopyranose mutase
MGRKRFLIVGAGFSGAVLARELVTRMEAEAVVIESRGHIAGNCHCERDAVSNVMVHVYGPHIFNTDNERVWEYGRSPIA